MRDRRLRAERLIREQHEKTPLLFIGGLGVESEGNATIQVLNPANGTAVGRSPAANVRDVERAVENAKASAEDWADAPGSTRAHVLSQMADTLEYHAEDLALLEAMQTGRSFREVLNGDLALAAAVLRHYAGWATRFGGESFDLGEGLTGWVRRRPVGVLGLILHWAGPLGALFRKAAPALASGSAVVVKPPEQAPLAIFRVAELMVQAGLPPGLLNVVPGFGAQAGEALALHPGVGALSFTGSIETARRVMLAAAKSRLQPVSLELGGKSANLVFEDANVRQAVGAIWKAIFTHRAVEPTGAARLLVHESLYEIFATTLTARAKEIVVGDPIDEHTELGPLVSEEHMKRALAYVELGRREGARLVAGGKREVDGNRSAGWFVQPTVFVDVTPSMRIAQEEIRGPILTILPFKSEEQALELANGTDYGMAAGVWTADLARAQRVARRLKAGTVWVNHYGRIDPVMPYGGVDLSGHGRDLGREALDRATFTQSIFLSSR